jgi:hypothetical protein
LKSKQPDGYATRLSGGGNEHERLRNRHVLPSISNQRPGRPHTALITCRITYLYVAKQTTLTTHTLTSPPRPIKLILGSWRLDRISFHSHYYSTIPTAGHHHHHHYSSTPTFPLFIYSTIRGTTSWPVVLSRPSIPHHVHGAEKSEWNGEIPSFLLST